MIGLPYWIVFSLAVAFAWFPKGDGRQLTILLGIGLVLLTGLRLEVGGDWDPYLSWVEEVRGVPLGVGLGRAEYGYALLNWLGSNGFGGIYFVNSVCAALAIGCLLHFCDRQASPGLALAVAIPYLVVVVFMGYTRQSVAIGFGMLAMLAVERRQVWPFLLTVTIAALFHRTAICLFVLAPAMFMPRLDRTALVHLAGIFAFGAALAVLVFGDDVASLSGRYVVSTGDSATLPFQGAVEESADGYRSSGAMVRLLQSVLAAASFVFIATRIKLAPAAFWLWTIVSVVVLCLFVLSFWRSTLADRTGLFFIPFQLYAFSMLPSLVRPPLDRLLTLAILLCSGATFWVWLNYGDHAHLWLPYQNVLQQWL